MGEGSNPYDGTLRTELLGVLPIAPVPGAEVEIWKEIIPGRRREKGASRRTRRVNASAASGGAFTRRQMPPMAIQSMRGFLSKSLADHTSWPTATSSTPV